MFNAFLKWLLVTSSKARPWVDVVLFLWSMTELAQKTLTQLA